MVRLPPAVAGQAVSQGVGDCALELRRAVGLDCLPKAAFCPGIKTEKAEVGDENVGLDAPQTLLPEAVRQPDHVRQHSRAVHAYSYPGRRRGQVIGER